MDNSFSEKLEEARKILPKISDNQEHTTKSKMLAESLLYYAELLQNEATTAVDLGAETKQILLEIAIEVGEISKQLVPSTPELKEILRAIGYYNSR